MLINHYAILGVEPDADLVQITAAWKRLLKKYHPDLNQNDEDATEQAVLLNKAFEILSNPEKRKQFDKQLEQQQRKTESAHAAAGSKSGASAPQPDSFTQPDDQSFQQQSPNKNSFANATQRNDKNSQFASVFSIVGIVLGALTAIPIGLFLIWIVSGFDPLGIFRQRSDQNVAKENSEEKTEKSGSKPTSKKQTGSDLKQVVPNIDISRKSETKEAQPKKKVERNASSVDKSKVKNPKQDANITDSKKATDPEVKKDADPINKIDEVVKVEPEWPGTIVDERLPIPSANAVESAKTKISEIFRVDYEAAKRLKGAEERASLVKLAHAVMKLAEDENDPATLYALFEIAIAIARESCHEKLPLAFVYRFEQRFVVDGLKMRVEVLKYLRSQLPLTVPKQDVVAVARILSFASKVVFRQAIQEERWAAATEMARVFRGFCLLMGDKEKADALKQVNSLLTKKLNEASKVRRYLEESDVIANDASKSLAIGAYLCFTKQQWDKGLGFLAESSDPKLTRVASSDLAAVESTFLMVADGWWDLALDKDYLESQLAILSRAKYYYWLAWDKATGLDKTKIEKRIADANSAIWGDGFFFDSLNNFESPSTGMKLIQVRKGHFVMGEHQKNIDASGQYASLFQHEGPRHPVTITKSFYLGQFEVNQDQWTKVMGTKPWTQDSTVGQDADYSAVYITWNEANEFCKRLSILDKRRYRLPTEAEWEYACRAGTDTRYSSGDTDASVLPCEWVRENAYSKLGQRSGLLIGTKLPNSLGFYDMHGNVNEWCLDSYDKDFYSRSPKVDPVNLAKIDRKVCRGGSIYGHSWSGRSASRHATEVDQTKLFIGVRILMEK